MQTRARQAGQDRDRGDLGALMGFKVAKATFSADFTHHVLAWENVLRFWISRITFWLGRMCYASPLWSDEPTPATAGFLRWRNRRESNSGLKEFFAIVFIGGTPANSACPPSATAACHCFLMHGWGPCASPVCISSASGSLPTNQDLQTPKPQARAQASRAQAQEPKP